MNLTGLVPFLGDAAGQPSVKLTAKVLGANVIDFGWDSARPAGGGEESSC